MATKTKNHEFEKIILKGILSSKDLCKRILTKNYKEDLFDIPIHQFVFKAASKRFNKSLDLISFDDLKYIVEKESKSNDEKSLRLALLENLDKEISGIQSQPSRHSFVWEELLRLYQTRKFFEIVDVGIERIKNNPNEDPLAVISSVEKLFYNVKRQSSTLLVDKEDIFCQESVDKRLERYLDEKGKPINRGLPYFLPKLTEVTGGIKSTDLVLFIARQKVGKSITLLNEAVYLTKLGYNVAYVSIEQSKEEITLRADSLATELKHVDIKMRKLDEHSENLYQAKLKTLTTFGKFFVIDIPRGCSINLIEKEIRDLIDHGTTINLIIIDYLGLLNSESNDGDKFYFNIGIMAKQLKELTRELKIPILTANQMTRASEKEKVKTSSGIAYSDQIGSHVDYCFALHPLGEGKMEIQTVLARDSEAVNVQCLTLFEKMLIFEMKNEAKKELEEDDLELL